MNHHDLIWLEGVSATSQIFASNHKNDIPHNTSLIKEWEIRFVLVVRTISVNKYFSFSQFFCLLIVLFLHADNQNFTFYDY